jgi:hypothetical protein
MPDRTLCIYVPLLTFCNVYYKGCSEKKWPSFGTLFSRRFWSKSMTGISPCVTRRTVFKTLYSSENRTMNLVLKLSNSECQNLWEQNSASYPRELLRFQSRSEDRISWLRFSWFPPVTTDKCQDNTSNYVITAPFQNLSTDHSCHCALYDLNCWKRR